MDHRLAPADSTALTRRRVGTVLLLSALALLLSSALRGVATPWEPGMRGSSAAFYSDGVVTHTLRYGLGVTLGMPAFITETDAGLDRGVNWHHPPLYWLYLTLAAWLFGHSPLVLRLAQLVVFLPALFALFSLVQRRAGPVTAGIASLLFAASPLVAYFGPMVLQDGAVLCFGLVAAWCFDRHLVGSGNRWLAGAALLFLLACLFDFPGYWWGASMLLLALASDRRRRGLAGVAVMFVASVLAFAITAVHYGLVLGGPLGYLRELLGAVSADGADIAITSERVSYAARQLLLEYANWPLLAASGLGTVIGVGCLANGCLAKMSTQPSRQLLLLGAALVVPGLLNVAAMFSHALAHVFWSVQGFAGLAVLATLLPVLGLQLLRRRRPVGVAAGVLLLVASMALVIDGAVATHRIVSRFAFVDGGTHAVMAKALPLLRGCAVALTSAPTATQVFFGDVSTWGGIDTPEKLELALGLGRGGVYKGEVGVVVAPAHRNSPLSAALDALAKRQVIDDVWVYRLRL